MRFLAPDGQTEIEIELRREGDHAAEGRPRNKAERRKLRDIVLLALHMRCGFSIRDLLDVAKGFCEGGEIKKRDIYHRIELAKALAATYAQELPEESEIPG